MADNGSRRLGEFTDLPENVKLHDLGAIHQSHDQFGVIQPVVWNTRTGHTIRGHGNIECLRQRKAAGDPPPVGIEVGGGDWLVPDYPIDIPREQEAAAAYVLNRTQDLAGYQVDLELQLLARIAAETPDLLPATGYDEDDIDRRIAKLAKGAHLDPEPEAQYPLAVVLNPAQYERWQEWKRQAGVKRDTEAFVRLLDEVA